MSDESVIPLPADVYYNILRRIKDLTFLWTTCRAVSRDFRDAVDLVFIRHHLRYTYLAADMGMWYSDKFGKVIMHASFAFDSLDPTDSAIALFKDTSCHVDFQPKLIQRLKGQFSEEFGNVCHAPRIVVQVRRLANDTPICDMKADWDSLSLTANWKKMFSEFFAEEKAYGRAMDAQLEAAKPNIVAMRDEDPNVAMKYLFEVFDTHDKTARRQVRDRRIKRHVWEQSRIEWTMTDSKGLRDAADARNALGWAEFSDDEAEPEEEQQEVADDDEEGEEIDEEEDDEEEDDEEEEEDDEEEEEDDEEETSEEDEDHDAGRSTKRRTEMRTRPRRSKTVASLPADQSTGPGPAPTGFAFTFKAPIPSGEVLTSSG